MFDTYNERINIVNRRETLRLEGINQFETATLSPHGALASLESVLHLAPHIDQLGSAFSRAAPAREHPPARPAASEAEIDQSTDRKQDGDRQSADRTAAGVRFLAPELRAEVERGGDETAVENPRSNPEGTEDRLFLVPRSVEL